MESLSTLKSRTETLCLELEQFEKQVKSKTVSSDEARQRWELTYKPEADYLAKQMLSYVASDDPRIMVVSQAGNRRIVKADVLNCIGAAFSEQYVSGHMHTVRSQLSGLAKVLPIEEDA